MTRSKRLALSLSTAALFVFGAIGSVPPAFAANARALPHIPVCPGVPAGQARCNSQIVATAQGQPQVATSPSGYGPIQFHTAYNLPTTSSSAQTIAIVDAYDDPNIESDLAFYSQTYGLAPCTTASGCFQKVDQHGGTRYPHANRNWALEISLDVEMAHAICQNCRILLVEAKSDFFSDLLTAVDYARAHGNEVSMSWGGSEFSSETNYDVHFSNTNVAFTASSGDNGYGVEYPAASSNVVAVGGTTLNLNSDNTYQSETAWNGSGSGCSAYETAQTWQTQVSDWSSTGCQVTNTQTGSTTNGRGVADVSADADPSTGAAVYDSLSLMGQSGWFQVGGTSLSSPLIASVYALAGGVSASAASIPYGRTSDLHDVASGTNGSCGTIMCSAGPGYDGPTGLGTPNWTAGF